MATISTTCSCASASASRALSLSRRRSRSATAGASSTLPRTCWQNEHLAARDYWVEVEHEDIGERVTYPGPWAKLSATPLSVRGRAPYLGEHNREVYGDLLGLSDDEIEQLASDGVI